jgi:hypothetical protein
MILNHLGHLKPPKMLIIVPKTGQGNEDLVLEPYRQVGQLKVELDWLKKSLKCSCGGEAEIDLSRK